MRRFACLEAVRQLLLLKLGGSKLKHRLLEGIACGNGCPSEQKQTEIAATEAVKSSRTAPRLLVNVRFPLTTNTFESEPCQVFRRLKSLRKVEPWTRNGHDRHSRLRCVSARLELRRRHFTLIKIGFE